MKKVTPAGIAQSRGTGSAAAITDDLVAAPAAGPRLPRESLLRKSSRLRGALGVLLMLRHALDVILDAAGAARARRVQAAAGSGTFHAAAGGLQPATLPELYSRHRKVMFHYILPRETPVAVESLRAVDARVLPAPARLEVLRYLRFLDRVAAGIAVKPRHGPSVDLCGLRALHVPTTTPSEAWRVSRRQERLSTVAGFTLVLILRRADGETARRLREMPAVAAARQAARSCPLTRQNAEADARGRTRGIFCGYTGASCW